MNDRLLDDIYELIITAIRSDWSSVMDVDEHDPLGIAFYVHALLSTGYSDPWLDSLPSSARHWVEDKVNKGNLSAYIDRDLGAVGLITYSLWKYDTLPNIDTTRLLEIVEPYYATGKGFFDNIFITILIGLGLRALCYDSTVFRKCAEHVRFELGYNLSVILNDPKNFYVLYLWAKETDDRKLTETLRRESQQRVLNAISIPTLDRLYYSYVLLNELGSLSGSFRLQVKRLVNENLRFVQLSTIESSTQELLEVYGTDLMMDPENMEYFGRSPKPRISRVALSVGLELLALYSRTKFGLFESERPNVLLRGVAYAVLSMLVIVLLFCVRSQFGVPYDLITPVGHADIVVLLVTVFLKLPANVLWISAIVTACVSAVSFLYKMSITGELSREIDVFRFVIGFLSQYWLIEILLALVISQVVAVR